MASQIYIDNGINVNAAWTDSIAISRDGVLWETISKHSLDIRPRIVNANTSSPIVNKEKTVRITLSRGSKNEVVFEFDADHVVNQATWQGNDPAAYIACVSDITSWIAPAGSGGATATEATQLLVLAAVNGTKDFEIKLVKDAGAGGLIVKEIQTYDQDTGAKVITYEDAAGAPYVLVGAAVYMDAEAVLSLVLAELVAFNADREITSVFVSEAAFPNPIIWEARNLYNSTAGTWSVLYYDEDGVVGVPAAALSLVEANNTSNIIDIAGNTLGAFNHIEDIQSDDNDPIVTFSLLKGGGKAVNTVAYAPAYTVDDCAMLAFDKDNGGLLVNQANLAEDEDEVTSFIKATASNVGALSKFRSLVVGNTGQVVKATTGNLYRVNIINRDNNDAIIVRFYDKATAPTAADTPVYSMTVVDGIGEQKEKEFPTPLNFTNGLGVRCSDEIADGSTAEPTDLPIIEIEYL